ncbi:carbohydrate binding domain-containing protein [Mucilaginibacter sp. UR6-1]|uniref:alpha-L-arabinofuranosidase C-terminal domain-containing protein n=1 Tax=Mucilaginibacter sp. UR6-1 TaxID=1435643 RepID=UPI001E3D5B43|nr:alpha-L-arabinofuranosidase C-terminal domain-containing protein [Mucilaginibacter sp. UR6-1]MCC8408994.1 carbohydrate binding domain-containing protein [Mucilaginibacter sp. UR6-1]
MINFKTGKIALVVGAVCLSASAFAQTSAVYTVDPTQLKATIQPTMYGIFFEDINMGADGGLYAELVKNRSFEFDNALMGWKVAGDSSAVKVVDRKAERPDNPHYINVTVPSAQGIGLSNEGFRGMGIRKGEGYNFSVIARQAAGSNVTIQLELRDESGKAIGSAVVQPKSAQWKKFNVSLTATAQAAKGSLYITLKGRGNIDLDMISLFPQHTWKNRANGLRADLVQMLADMKPGFIRFPGGCIVEGRYLVNRYQWKKTIGDVDKRETIINRWNTEFKHRSTPDYFQSFGLGFMEYFMLAEDIGAEPLPILNCGMACQFNSGELVPVDQIDPYVQDALDLIEFANGDASTKWGKLRISLGHPAKFNLKMLGVGNENWGPNYVERWTLFRDAIKKKYPQVKIVTSTGTDPDGARFDTLNTAFRGLKADILDEHYYRPPQWFRDNAKRYDSYDRNGPKIFAGEYAAHVPGVDDALKKNNLEAALAEAAFMTGLERNADVVNMASYAPLFAHVDAWQWAPDLIWFDNLKHYGTPNYYVQKLYSLNKGTNVVPMLLNGQPIAGQDGIYANATINKNTKELLIKVVNVSGKSHKASLDIKGLSNYQTKAWVTTLTSDKPDVVNSLEQPQFIAPAEGSVNVSGSSLVVDAEPYSFKVIKLKMK